MIEHSTKNDGRRLRGNLFYSVILLIYLTPVMIIYIHGSDDLFQFLRRITALTGITSLFIAILLSLLVKQSKQIFGMTYLRIHHFFSISGLILITLHPVIMAIDFGTSRIFIPDFSSWDSFLTNAGRPALYIVYIATIAAILRRSMVKYWKYFHGLLYPAFVFGAVHGIRQGSDLSNPILYVMFITFIILVIMIFFYKKYLTIKKVVVKSKSEQDSKKVK